MDEKEGEKGGLPEDLGKVYDLSQIARERKHRSKNTFEHRRLNLRMAAEHKPKPLDFVLPGLKSGTVGALVSPGATGKTMWALQAAVTVAGGPDLLGLANMDKTWRQTKGRVSFLSGEDPDEILAARFHEIAKRLSLDEREIIFENLSISPLIGYETNLMNQTWLGGLKKETQGARLIIIDTLRRFHQLEENDGGQMAKLLAIMEQLCKENETTVLFLHHTSKAGAFNNGDAQQASRGSSVLTDNARFQANLINMSPEQAKEFGISENSRGNFVRLSFSKINYTAPIPDQWFRRSAGGMLEPTTLKRLCKKGNQYESKKGEFDEI